MAKVVSHQDLKSLFGSEDHLQLSQSTSFAALIFETLSEKKPTEAELKVFELILNLSIDHGAETPSAVPLIEKAKTGATISEAVAEGILQINDRHGGAIEPCMKYLYRIKNDELGVNHFVEETIEQNKRLAGLGHRIYKDSDPRTELMEKVCQENSISTEYFDLLKQIQSEFESQSGKHLAINIDGGIAAILCALDWDPKLANAVFIIARVPGLCAHFLNNS